MSPPYNNMSVGLTAIPEQGCRHLQPHKQRNSSKKKKKKKKKKKQKKKKKKKKKKIHTFLYI